MRYDQTSWWASVLREAIVVHEKSMKRRQRAYDKLEDKTTGRARKALDAIKAEKLLLMKYRRELNNTPKEAKEK